MNRSGFSFSTGGWFLVKKNDHLPALGARPWCRSTEAFWNVRGIPGIPILSCFVGTQVPATLKLVSGCKVSLLLHIWDDFQPKFGKFPHGLTHPSSTSVNITSENQTSDHRINIKSPITSPELTSAPSQKKNERINIHRIGWCENFNRKAQPIWWSKPMGFRLRFSQQNQPNETSSTQSVPWVPSGQQASFFVRGACFVFSLILLLLLVIYVFAQRPRRDCGTTFRQHFEVQELNGIFSGGL